MIVLSVMAGVAGANLVPLHPSAAKPPAAAVHAGLESVGAAGRSIAPAPSARIGASLYSVTPPTAIGSVGAGDILLVDPVTETLYSVSYAGVVTASNALTGANASTHWMFGADGARYINGAGVDPATDQLFLSIIPSVGSNYIWAVNGQTFAVTGNVTSFGGSVGYSPAGIYYESGSGRMLVLNSSDYGGSTFVAAVLDPGTLQIKYVFTFTCGLYSCYVPAGGVTDFPNWDIELVTADSNISYFLNTLNYTIQVYSLYALTSLGPTAYDPTTGAFLFSNESVPSVIYEATITGLYPLSGTVFNATYSVDYLTAISWDPLDKYFVAAGEDPTTGLVELSALNASGAVKANFTEAAGTGFGDVVGTVAWSAAGTETILVNSGYANQTLRVVLSLSNPRIQLAQSYYDYPYTTVGLGVDSTRGIVVEGTKFPAAVRAFSATTAQPIWTDYQSNLTSFSDVAVDSALGTVYVSHGTSGIEVLNSTTGAVVGTIAAPDGAGHLFLDEARGVLFAQWWLLGGWNLTAFDLTGTGATLGGTVTVTLGGINGVTVDSAADRVWVSSAGTAEVFNETSFAWVKNVSTPGANMYNLGSDGQGRIFLESNVNPANYQIGVYDELTGVWGPNVTLGQAGGGYAADVADHYLWLEAGAASIQAYNYLTGALVTTLALPDTWWWNGWTDSLAWDSASSTVAVSGGLSGVELASLVPIPTAPTSLQATTGNGSVYLTWHASTGSVGYPVNDYWISDAPSPSGPWTSLGSETVISASIGGLINGNTYYFEVEADSASGNSSPSNVVSATPATVPYPVLTPNSQATGDGSIVVTWLAPSNNGGSAITAYVLYYGMASSGPFTSVPVGNVLTHNLTGLQASTTYYVRIAAQNAIGIGNPGGIGSATTKSMPTGPGNPSKNTSGGGSSFPILWVAVIVVVVVAAIAGALLAMRSRRGRGQPPAPPSGAMFPASGGPSGPTQPPSSGGS